MVGQLMLNYAMNEGVANGHYQYFAVLVMINASVNMRTRYSVAVPLSVVVVSIFTLALLTGNGALEAKVAGISTMVAATFISLVGNMRFDWDTRHYFLRSMQDKLRFKPVEEESMNDALTGLRNRRYLDEFAARMMPEIYERRQPLGAIMLDIDHFKDYNDEYGHQMGDDCIRAVARAISACIRNSGDCAVRYGGEEFLVLLPGADEEQVVKAAERIRRAVLVMQIPHSRSAVSDVVTVSLGVSSGMVSADFFPAFIASADAALYAAKEGGRNRVCAPECELTETQMPDGRAWGRVTNS